MAIFPTSGILPPDRLYDWSSYCGIPGGIPDRTKIFRTMKPSDTPAEINAAIAACPSGQVIFLSAGTYDLSSNRITFPLNSSGVTLRGAGPGRTIITASVSNCINNTYRHFLATNGKRVRSGFSRGSTSIVLDSPPDRQMSAGNLIVITEDSSPDKFDTGIGTYARDGLTSGLYENIAASRCHRYVTRIVNVAGSTIRLASPLPLDFKASLNVMAFPQNGSGVMSLCGVENLTVFNCSDPIRWYFTDRCWVKGVEFSRCSNGDVGFLQLNSSFQFEMRGCYIHDATGYPGQSDGIGVGVNYGVCNGLFIDNIGNRISAMFEINGAVANAFLYNYVGDCARAGGPAIMPAFFHHGPLSTMNLIEGNVANMICTDGYHGSDSHGVIFRNNFNGLHSTFTFDRRLITLVRGSYYYSVVGNILGDPSWNPTAYETPVGWGHERSYVYMLGFPNSGSGSMSPEMKWSTHPNVYPDAAVASTLIRHGNYDYFNKAVIWDNNIASRDIPAQPILFFQACCSSGRFDGRLSDPMSAVWLHVSQPKPDGTRTPGRATRRSIQSAPGHIETPALSLEAKPIESFWGAGSIQIFVRTGQKSVITVRHPVIRDFN